MNRSFPTFSQERIHSSLAASRRFLVIARGQLLMVARVMLWEAMSKAMVARVMLREAMSKALEWSHGLVSLLALWLRPMSSW